METKALYAGTFDPLTLGHLDLIERAAGIFNELIVAVVAQPVKPASFSIEERVAMAADSTAEIANVEIVPFDGLLVNFAKSRQVRVLVRGIRVYSDFENEFQMALTNRRLATEIETLFLMPKDTYSYISSTLVREVARCGGDTGALVPPPVAEAIGRKWRPQPTTA